MKPALHVPQRQAEDDEDHGDIGEWCRREVEDGGSQAERESE